MRKIAFVLGVALMGSVVPAWSQVSGSVGIYGNDSATAATLRERGKRNFARSDDKNSTYVEASVLMNVKADEYVAFFAASALAPTTGEAGAKLTQQLDGVKESWRKMGVRHGDVTVDFIAQVPIYRDVVTGEAVAERKVIEEKLSGFEVKKTIAVRYRDAALTEPIVEAASRGGLNDLMKVDYRVRDLASLQAKLQLQTMEIIRRKIARYSAELQVPLSTPRQIVVDAPGVYAPDEQYVNYEAAETNKADYSRSEFVRLPASKISSAYFSPLEGSAYDAVINPNPIEPVVQLTTYIVVRCENTKARGR